MSRISIPSGELGERGRVSDPVERKDFPAKIAGKNNSRNDDIGFRVNAIVGEIVPEHQAVALIDPACVLFVIPSLFVHSN